MINFPTPPYQTLHQFNEDFEKAVSALQEDWVGRNVKELATTDQDFQPIVELLNNNISLLSRNNNIGEVIRFIKTSYQIPLWINKNSHLDHSVLDNTIIKSSLAILHLCKERIHESIYILKSIRAINETLFLDLVVDWVNEEKIPLKNFAMLKLVGAQLIQIAPRLTHLDFSETKCQEDFIEKLFEKSEKVKCIIFEDSEISGTCFKFLKNTQTLEAIILKNCPKFNQQLPNNLLSLQKLEISNCEAFNQQLPNNLPSLQKLEISECEAFNQQLPDNLSSLHQLWIYDCEAFDQKLPDNLPSLQKLQIYGCNAFDQKLPNELPYLQQLEIYDCKVFDQKLPNNLPFLQTLMMSCLKKFNQKLPDNLPSLLVLEITSCKTFNQQLPNNLPSLKRLKLNCDDFNPFSHDVKTALLLSQFDLAQFKEMWVRLTRLTKQRIAQKVINARDSIKVFFDYPPEKLLKVAEAFEIPLESFKQAYPDEITYFTLIEIDKERALGGSDEDILTLFRSLKGYPNYLETLKKMLRSFPSLTSFILRKKKNELMRDIENLRISTMELPSETKWSLLPLLKADDIVQMIHLTSKDERTEWLQEKLHFDRFSGPVAMVLKSVKEANIDGSTTDSRENLTSTILELLQMIPFKTLAALTFDDENLKTILAYLPFMEEQQLTVVIPVFPKEIFIDYLDKQLLNTHPDTLVHATQLQKEIYLEKRVIKQYVLSLKEKLTTFKQLMETNQNPRNEEKVKQDFTIFHASITQQLHSIPNILNRTKEALLNCFPTKKFCNNIETYSNEISSMITLIGNEMIEINHRIDSNKEEFPEEFIDNITGEIMTDPYRDERSGNILDKQTWDKVNGENPFNRQPISKLLEEVSLKERIQKYLAEKQIDKNN